MRRLVSRFIHQWKKQMRHEGVNEDDLLEIKQDISSLRWVRAPGGGAGPGAGQRGVARRPS